MADFLDICGMRLDCDQLSMKPEPIGAGVTRSGNAAAHSNEQDSKWHGTGRSVVLSRDDALFYAALLSRRLEHWPFNADAYGDKGFTWSGAPTLPSGVSIGAAAPAPKYGGGYLKLAVSATNIAINTPKLTDGWAFAIWFAGGNVAWDLYIITGSGSVASGGAVAAAWKNGAAQAATMPTWASVSVSSTASVLTLKSSGSIINNFDDLVVIASQISSGVAAQLDTYLRVNTSGPWPTAPTLSVSGDFHPTTLSVLGEGASTENVTGNLLDGSGFKPNLRRLSFDLLEV